jgi:hypothetical protein
LIATAFRATGSFWQNGVPTTAAHGQDPAKAVELVKQINDLLDTKSIA